MNLLTQGSTPPVVAPTAGSQKPVVKVYYSSDVATRNPCCEAKCRDVDPVCSTACVKITVCRGLSKGDDPKPIGCGALFGVFLMTKKLDMILPPHPTLSLTLVEYFSQAPKRQSSPTLEPEKWREDMR